MIRTLLVSMAVALFAVACGGTTATPAVAPVASTASRGRPMDPARVARLATIVAELRGHPFVKPLPPVRFVPRAELPTFRGPGGQATQLAAEGGYDGARHEILVADDLENTAELEPTIVHELVHALLTDHGVHHLVTTEEMPELRVFAHAALVEGDANLVEAGFRAHRDGGHPQRTMAGVTRVHVPWLPLACRALADSSTCALAGAIYDEGRVFASALYRVGGTALLDAAHKAPPTTALEIFYPDLYLAGIKEQSLAEPLDVALAAEGIPTKRRVQAGVLRLARTFAADVDAEVLRAAFRGLRGDASASLARGGQIVLTEWGDDRSATALAGIIAAQGTRKSKLMPAKLIGQRRLLIGINVPRELVDSVAKHVSSETSALAPAPPLGRAIAPGPSTWEEELAAALRMDGARGLRLVGVDAGTTLRSGGPDGTSHLWLFPNDEKVFLVPVTARALTRTVLIQTLEKAWFGPVEKVTDATSQEAEEQEMPIGAVRLFDATLRTPATLRVAIARVPICGHPEAALMAMQFGTDATVRTSLAKNLALLQPVASGAGIGALCKRLHDDA